MHVVQAINLKKTINLVDNHISILEGVDLSVNAGESVVILGVSGSGKSTLLGLLAGLDNPTQGQISLLGQDLSQLNETKRAQLRHRIGFVFQHFHLLEHLNALENVMLPCEIKGDSNPKEKAMKVLEEVGLKDRIYHYPNQLSGGEQQRVALARAFVIDPELIFADEPTGSLDEGTGEQIIDLLFRLNRERQTTLVVVTHDSHLAKKAEQHFRLEHGTLEKQ